MELEYTKNEGLIMFCTHKDKIEELEKKIYDFDNSISKNIDNINWTLWELTSEVSRLRSKVDDKVAICEPIKEPVIAATSDASNPNVMRFSISPKVIDKLKTIDFLVSAYPYYSATGQSARERAIELLKDLIKDFEGK
jgi:hypothetical protein